MDGVKERKFSVLTENKKGISDDFDMPGWNASKNED